MKQEIKHTVASHFARVHIANAERIGLDRGLLLREAGLAEALLQEPKARIAPRQLAAIFQTVWRESDDEMLGLTEAPIRVGVFSLIAERMVESETLGDALDEMMRFYHLVTNSFCFEKRVAGDQVALSIALAKPEYDPDNILIEMLLLIWHRFPNWLVGQQIPLREVNFTYLPKAYKEEYPLLFPGLCRVKQPQNMLVWPAEVLRWPIRRNREQLRGYLRRAPLPWFRKQKIEKSFTDQISRLLETSSLDDSASFTEIASQLHMTERTLRRKLTEEGGCFHRLKGDIRRDRAIYWLSKGDVSIAEISHHAGYADPAAFIRAFKAWTGLPPGLYRRRLLAAE